MSDIDKLQEMIDKSKKIVFFGGAGVSTDSGIKDFRSSDGLYNMKYKYPVEMMLSSNMFYQDTESFYEFYKDNFNCLDIKPNITHKYLKKLEDNNKLLGVVTQNIDGLHSKAGSKNVYEVHGTILKNHCLNCNKLYDAKYIFDSKGIPKCTCGGIIKPDVVLYGEMLPEKDFSNSCKIIREADLLIVAGTSLTVQPACGMIDLFHGKYLVIINKTPTPYDRFADLVIHDNLSKVFGELK